MAAEKGGRKRVAGPKAKRQVSANKTAGGPAGSVLEQQVAARIASLEKDLQRMRRIALELAQADQREKQRLARLLHDDLQQFLVAAAIRVERAISLTAEPEAKKALGSVSAMLDQASRAAKTIASEIRPSALQEKSLPDSLKWLTDWVKTNFALEIKTSISAEAAAAELPGEIVTFLFEAARELFFNIVKHAGVNTAELTVQIDRGGLSLTLTIEDRGQGFGGDPLAADASARGFGLRSIRNRADLLGGRLEIRSEAGKYFNAQIVFPYFFPTRPQGAGPRREKRTAAAAGHGPFIEVRPLVLVNPQQQGQPASGQGLRTRVLLADDHKIVREGLTLILQEEADLEVVGYAATGRQAVEQARKLKPDVVVMDVNMPEMNGIEATRAIKAELPEVRIIGLSVNGDQNTAKAMTSAGAAAYVQKSIPAEELCTVIRQCRGRG